MNKSVFAQNLKFLRLHFGLSQAALASELSISRNKIASYESRNIELICEMARYFNISVDDLLRVRIDMHNIQVIQSSLNASKARSARALDARLPDHEALYAFVERHARIMSKFKNLEARLADQKARTPDSETTVISRLIRAALASSTGMQEKYND